MEAEKWARLGPRVGAIALAKEPPHLSAAFHLRPCQLLVGVKCGNGVRGGICGFKSWHTSGAAEATNGARDTARGVFLDEQRAACAASSPASGVQVPFGVRKLSARESRVFH